MSRFIVSVVIILLGCSHWPALASNVPKVITVGVSFSSKPYVFANDKGIIPDLIREALAYSDYRVKFLQMSNQQLIDLFERGQLDAIAIGNKNIVNGYLSSPYISFTNMAMTLADDSLDIADFRDLDGKRVVAFSEANKYLGENFKKTVAAQASYREVARQWEQVALLMKGETDVVIADGMIFKYYLRQFFYQSPEHQQYLQKVVYHPIFSVNHYSAVFQDRTLRDAFDQGVERLEQSGKMDYLRDYNQNLLGWY